MYIRIIIRNNTQLAHKEKANVIVATAIIKVKSILNAVPLTLASIDYEVIINKLEVLLSNLYDEKGYVIIGEAALSLALKDLDITVPSIIRELTRMAEGSISDERIYSISEARNWLIQATERDVASVPYIKTILGLNDEKIRYSEM